MITFSYDGNQELKEGRIIDVNGKIVKNMDLNNFNTQKQFDISQLAAGMYFVQIQSTSESTIKKLGVK